MSIPVNELHKDVVFRHRGDILRVLDYKHKSMARGKADIKIKALNLSSGTTIEVNFKSGQTVEEVSCHTQNMEYVFYDARKNLIFLADPETKKRYSVSGALIAEDKRQYLESGVLVRGLVLDDENKIIDVEIPITAELAVKETAPSEKGDTATGGSKSATLSTGAVVQVPMFIKPGDVVKVNTERGEYMERVSNA